MCGHILLIYLILFHSVLNGTIGRVLVTTLLNSTDPDLTQLVTRSCLVLIPSATDDDMDLLSQKLKLLKREVKSWIKKKELLWSWNLLDWMMKLVPFLLVLPRVYYPMRISRL